MVYSNQRRYMDNKKIKFKTIMVDSELHRKIRTYSQFRKERVYKIMEEMAELYFKKINKI